MGIDTKGLVLLGILISATGTVPVFAQAPFSQNASNTTVYSTTPPPISYQPAYNKLFHTNQTLTEGTSPSSTLLTVTTDKSSYNDGDTVTISGTSRDYLGNIPVTIMVKNPIGNIVRIDQINMTTDKTFSDSITATGLLWQAAGNYTVYAQYGGPTITATTSFQFAGSHISQGNTFPVDGTNSSVTYSITNGKVLDIKADQVSKSLIVTIQTTGDGSLTITMPRALIDSKKTDGADDQFFVLNDGQEDDQFQEAGSTTTERTLQIPFSYGTSQIEIVGTFVIPEFGPIAALVLVISVISIIAISAKTRLRFMYRV